MSGIAIVGGNGAGKTTLGKHLASITGYKHIDMEDYFFVDRDYSSPRSNEEVRALLLEDIEKHPDFILSSVNGDMGEAINRLYSLIVYIDVPIEVRLERVQQRSLKLFGARMLEDGKLYAQEQAFFDYVAQRSLDRLHSWVERMGVPVLRVDGRKPVAENAEVIRRHINGTLHEVEAQAVSTDPGLYKSL